jgi:hypothetical protein
MQVNLGPRPDNKHMYVIVHAVLDEGSSHIATVTVKDKQTLVSPTLCFLLCAAIKNLLKPSQAKPSLLLLHSVADEAKQALCLLTLTSAIQDCCSVLLAEVYIMLGGRSVPSAQIAAIIVTQSLDLSWRADIISFDSQSCFKKTCFDLLSSPIMKPFLSIL